MNISIIISTYNRPDYLKKTIEGYLHQNRWPDEIIIADDGSTNDTAEMIKEIQKNSKIRILHIWHEDKGFRAARIRNKAVAKSSG
ncbi:glycosyltransferase [Thermodesulfovibrionales bacterium]|nr:glycosyltransferase [Thermodesulfovibrionales bacterium]